MFGDLHTLMYIGICVQRQCFMLLLKFPIEGINRIYFLDIWYYGTSTKKVSKKDIARNSVGVLVLLSFTISGFRPAAYQRYHL